MERRWHDAYLRRRFAWLLVLLLATIGVDPVLESVGVNARGLESMLALALSAAAVGEGMRGTHVARGLALVFVATLTGWLVLRLGGFDAGTALAPALLGASGLLMAGLLLPRVLAGGRVDGERICAALCVYLLVGIGLGGLFAALEAAAPGSLTGAWDGGIGSAVYFSFVTLATLGYGDIAPAAPAARSLAMLEAVFGQLYLAVLIARLVSLYERKG